MEALEEKKALLLAQFEQDFKLSPEEDSESDSEGLYLHGYMSRMILVNVSLKFKFFLGMKGTMDGKLHLLPYFSHTLSYSLVITFGCLILICCFQTLSVQSFQ